MPAASAACSAWRLRPDASSGRFFVNFTNRSGDTVVARFRRSADPLVADPAIAIRSALGGAGGAAAIAQPFSNHNGGHLAFGPDGYLYIGLGDGGPGTIPITARRIRRSCSARCCASTSTLPTAHAIGYQVPADNPFVGGGPVAARPEIWAFGLRNPWRYSFDDPARGGTGALIIGDVGQGAWEEIDYEPREPRRPQLRLAQPRRRARQRHVARRRRFCRSSIRFTSTTASSGQSVTGGYVYRGRALGSALTRPLLLRRLRQGRVWSLALTIDSQGEARASGLTEHTAELGGQSQLGNISSFGVDADGELYIVSLRAGRS